MVNFFSSDTNINSLFFSIDHQMPNLGRWIIFKKTIFKFVKNSYIIFLHDAVAQNLNIFIRNQKLSSVSYTNFLGIHIDEKIPSNFIYILYLIKFLGQ